MTTTACTVTNLIKAYIAESFACQFTILCQPFVLLQDESKDMKRKQGQKENEKTCSRPTLICFTRTSKNTFEYVVLLSPATDELMKTPMTVTETYRP
jgi:hypothetical protein